jgi:hypothetical protein
LNLESIAMQIGRAICRSKKEQMQSAVSNTYRGAVGARDRDGDAATGCSFDTGAAARCGSNAERERWAPASLLAGRLLEVMWIASRA